MEISEKDKKLLAEIQDRVKRAKEDDDENRKIAYDDLEFVGVEGAQWPAGIKAQRTADGRPCLTINKMPAFIDQVVGDQRMNRPAINVVPVDSYGDIEVARILGGWIKHVQAISKADIAIDHAFEHAVTCGYGAMRVVTKWVNDTSLDQEAYIEKIDNALAVYWGKHSEYDCSDAAYCIILTEMGRDEYEEKYKQPPMEFNVDNSQYVDGWCDKDNVRLAEYFVKEFTPKTIYLLSDGRVVEKKEDFGDALEVRKRLVESYKIMWYLASGDRILERKEWAGKKYIPVIPVWGKELNVGGKRVIRGLIRHGKDSQRMYNYWQSSDTEVVTLQPKVPYLVTPKQISGHERQWKESHKRNFPYLLVNFDEKAPGWPKREAPPQASSAMIERIQNADQEMRDTIGLQKASMGMQSNERSGTAIIERKKEGDVGTFAFIDNLTRSIEHVGRVLIDVAPGILDTERVVRLGLEDGKQEFVTVNKDVSENDSVVGQIQNDLSVGTYDVVVEVGPSFTTQRSEARQSMSEFIQYYPNAAPLIGDLYAKSMDWPGAQEVSKRLEFLLPPEVRKQKEDEAIIRAGGTPPPPVPPPPDPEVLMAQQQGELKLQEGQLKLQLGEQKLQEGQIKLQDSQIKHQEAMVGFQEAQVKLKEAQIKLEQENAKLAGLVQDIRNNAVEFVRSQSEKVAEKKPE